LVLRITGGVARAGRAARNGLEENRVFGVESGEEFFILFGGGVARAFWLGAGTRALKCPSLERCGGSFRDRGVISDEAPGKI